MRAAQGPPHGEAIRTGLARIPPPPAFAVPIVVGLIIQRWIPVPIVSDSVQGIARVVGSLLLGLGVALAATCLALFLYRRTTVIPHRSATALVTNGPYGLSRNPMYVALTSICLGAAAFSNVLWALLLLPAPLLLVAMVHIPLEERMLRAAFGDEYRRYASRVRRWL